MTAIGTGTGGPAWVDQYRIAAFKNRVVGQLCPGQGIAKMVEDLPVAVVVDDDGRRGCAGAGDLLQMAQFDAFGAELLAYQATGVIVADRADEAHLDAEPGHGQGGVGGHASADTLEVMGRCLGGTLRKRVDLEYMVDRRVADAGNLHMREK